MFSINRSCISTNFWKLTGTDGRLTTMSDIFWNSEKKMMLMTSE